MTAGGVYSGAAPTAGPPALDGPLQLPAHPFTRGSQPPYLGVASHTPPPFPTEPPGYVGPLQPPRPFSRGWAETPTTASASPLGMARPTFPAASANQPAAFGLPLAPPRPPTPIGPPAPHPPAPRVLPFSRPRRDPPPPPLQTDAPLYGSSGVQSGSGHQHRKRRREGSPQAPKRRRLPENKAGSAQQFGAQQGHVVVTNAWQSHAGLQAAAQAVANSTAAAAQAVATSYGPAQTAAVAGGGVAPAETGSSEAVQSTGLPDAALAGQTLSPSATRFAASSFGSSSVQAAVKETAEGVKSSYDFSF